MPTVTVKLTRAEIDDAIRDYVAEILPEAGEESLKEAKLAYSITVPKKGGPQLTAVTVEVQELPEEKTP